MYLLHLVFRHFQVTLAEDKILPTCEFIIHTLKYLLLFCLFFFYHRIIYFHFMLCIDAKSNHRCELDKKEQTVHVMTSSDMDFLFCCCTASHCIAKRAVGQRVHDVSHGCKHFFINQVKVNKASFHRLEKKVFVLGALIMWNEINLQRPIVVSKRNNWA